MVVFAAIRESRAENRMRDRAIYLDHNSTAPILPDVVAAMVECYGHGYSNPASQHRAGGAARRRLESAHDEIARILHVPLTGRTPDRVVFTSGGTEANNLAILGLATEAERTHSAPHEIVTSSIEHPSIAGPVEQLERRGWLVHRLRANVDGVVHGDELPSLLGPHTRLVSIMLANNETGVLQPIERIAAVCREAGVPIHTDAVQVAGKVPLDFAALGVDAMTIAAHKFHGPLGIGALLLKGSLKIAPSLFGGFQQGGLRPGTESVVLAVGMEAALNAFERDCDERRHRLHSLRNRFEAGLISGCPELLINGERSERLPNTSNLAFPGIDRREMFLALDMAGLFCSTGSACASGSSEPSPVLRAMGLPERVVHGSLRFSLGVTTTEAEIDAAIERILAAYTRLTSPKRSQR
jgi:cysteine desulfurase